MSEQENLRVTLAEGASRPRVFLGDGSEVKGVQVVTVEMGNGMWPRAELTVEIAHADVTCELEKLYGVFNGKRYRMVEVGGKDCLACPLSRGEVA